MLDADIAILVDRSLDVTSMDIQYQYGFAKFLAAKFSLSQEALHLGVISYADTSKLEMAWRDYLSVAAFNSAVDKLSLTVGGEARLDKAVGFAVSQLFAADSGMRTGKKK